MIQPNNKIAVIENDICHCVSIEMNGWSTSDIDIAVGNTKLSTLKLAKRKLKRLTMDVDKLIDKETGK